MFASAPAQSLKPQMTRSVSSNSNVQQYPHHSCEVAPGLVSSASSSTVGSPYSGPMHPDTLQNTGDAFSTEVLSQGLGLLPTIVNQDGYTQEFVGTGFDADMPMGHDKLNGNFVGESADLSSSQKRSSTLSFPINRMSHNASPATPLGASPELPTANAVVTETNHVPAPAHPTSVSVSRSASLPVSAPQQSSVEPVFKSPTTPASAYTKTPNAHSPNDRRWPSHGAHPVASPTQQPVVVHPNQPMRQHGGQFQSHFFAQSSGNFMPPLETTCSFSFLLSAFL
jgi:hypothetical protein